MSNKKTRRKKAHMAAVEREDEDMLDTEVYKFVFMANSAGKDDPNI